MDPLPPIPPRPSHYNLRLALGLALILPVPLIVLTVAMFATGDFKRVPVWVGDWTIYALPILSVIGFAVLPTRPWLRVGLGCLLIPIFCVALVIWMIILSCNAFDHCSNWSLV